MPIDTKETLRATVAILREVPDSWPRAGEASGARLTVFQSREFIEAWTGSFGATGAYEPYFVTISEPGGRTIMLLPLVVERRHGIRVLSFMDQGQADYNAPILFEPGLDWTVATVEKLWRQILAALPPVDAVDFRKMPETVGGLRNPLRLLASGPEDAAAHGNVLSLPWAEVEKHLFGVKEVRRKERALARVADAQLVMAENLSQRSAFIDELVAQKQRRFVETKVPGFSEQPAALAFLRQATEIFAADNKLLLCALDVNGTIAAVQWGLIHDRTVYALVSSYRDGPLSQFSCGRLLDSRLIKVLHERGFAYFDQGYGDEAYKLRNTDTDVPLFRALLGLTRRGRVYLAAGRWRAGLRESRLGAQLRSAKWALRERLGLRKLPKV